MQSTSKTTSSDSSLFWRMAPVVFVLFWSGGYSFAKLGLPYIEPLTFLTIRYALAVVVLAPLLMRAATVWPQSARHWAAIAVTGFLIQCVYFGLAYLAMKRGMNAGTAAIIMSLQPILIAALSPFLFGAKGGWQLWVGLVLGFIGVLVIIIAGDTLGASPWIASILALTALLGITIATLFEKWHGLKTDPVVGGVVQYVVGFAVLAPVAFFTESQTINWHSDLFIALGYLVIANSIISVSLYVALIQRGDATRISALMYLVPPLALLIAWAVLGETITPAAFAGFVLCVTGVYIVNRATR